MRDDPETLELGRQGARAVVPRWMTLSTLCFAVLIAQLDTSVVNLGTKPIGAYFQASVPALQWVVDAYNLVYAVLLLTGGLLADLRGRRLVFMAGVGVFTGASVLSAAAPSVAVLIAGRAVAGLGAALMLPASLAIIRVVWTDPAERGHALGIWAGCNGVSLAIGPTLGGLLIEWLGWRSIFAVVVPVGIAALTLALPAVPESADPNGRHFDPKGQALGAFALGSLAYAAIAEHDAPFVAAGAFAASMVALAEFILTERRLGNSALVPLGLFRVRAFRAAVVATTGMTFGMYGVIFLTPLSWQSTGMLSPVQAGLALLPMALVFVFVSPLSGRVQKIVGARVITCGGVAVIASGMFVLAAAARSHALWPAECGLALTGLGMGLATGPLMGEAVGAVPPNRSGTASALINAARMAGATIGVAVLGAIYAGAQHSRGGLRWAMLAGGAFQAACVMVSWIDGGRR